MIASESVAMYSSGFELVRDLEPGEAVVISMDGKLFTRAVCRFGASFRPVSSNMFILPGPIR